MACNGTNAEQCDKFYREIGVPFLFQLSILVDVSRGLEFLHGWNIIHGDLYSNNVLLTKQCVAKIADLGVAKALGHSKTKILNFMPPEAISAELCYDKAVDVFSLACIILHVLSHHWPQLKEDKSLTEVQRREEYLASCTEPSFKQLVESCLHIDPKQRPEISHVHMMLRKLKDENDKETLFATTSFNYVDLFNYIKSKMVRADAVRSDLCKELEEMKILLTERDQEIKELKEINSKDGSVSERNLQRNVSSKHVVFV